MGIYEIIDLTWMCLFLLEKDIMVLVLVFKWKTTKKDHQNLKLRKINEDENEIQFIVRITMALGKLKSTYAHRIQVPLNELRFLYNGKQINDDATPEDFEMQDYDTIDVCYDA